VLAQRELGGLVLREPLARPLRMVRQRMQRLDELDGRLVRVTREWLRDLRGRLDRAAAVLLRFRTGARFVQAERDLEQRWRRLVQVLNQRMLVGERRLAQHVGRLQQVQPVGRVRQAREHLDGAGVRLATALRQALAQRRGLLEARLPGIAACDPRAILKRGYSITRDARTRRIVRSTAQVRDGQHVITEVTDGEFRSTVEDPRQPKLFP
jgi:exodeoxyribonuclease VII large subunit